MEPLTRFSRTHWDLRPVKEYSLSMPSSINMVVTPVTFSHSESPRQWEQPDIGEVRAWKLTAPNLGCLNGFGKIDHKQPRQIGRGEEFSSPLERLLP